MSFKNEDILKNVCQMEVNGVHCFLVTDILQNIFLCLTETKKLYRFGILIFWQTIPLVFPQCYIIVFTQQLQVKFIEFTFLKFFSQKD